MNPAAQTERPGARWLLPSIDDGHARSLAAALGVSLLAARVLCWRGLSEADAAREFLHPSLDKLHDPFLMLGMRAAVERIQCAIGRRELILIYGDYDVDGTTSVVILKKAIELAGGQTSFHVPHRLKDGYGMRPEVVERAAGDGVRLIVSVDTGIRAAETVRRASEVGIDVIITDHHLPETELPPALAILNPNRPGCPYPEKNLCGVGVTFKLVQALLSAQDWPHNRRRQLLESFLKLVAIGTVADVVPLTGENRVIVRHGLGGLDVVKNPGLRALLDVAGFAAGTAPSAGQVAFRIAPRINAAGRMATANDVIELFLTSDANRAKELAGLLHDLNAERQQTELDVVEAILDECSRSPVTNAEASLVFAGENWHRGVLGIVASRIVERFHRPAFVLSTNPEDGVAQGSGRSIASFHLLQALEAMPDLFTKFGGHFHAAGLTLPASNVLEFRRRFNEYAASILTPEDFVPSVQVDAEAELAEINDRSAEEVLALAPFGCGNPSPVFLVHDVEVAAAPTMMKEKHIRVPFRKGGRVMVLKAWNFAGRAGDLVPGTKVDILLQIEEDLFSLSRGYSPWSLTLKDFRAARS